MAGHIGEEERDLRLHLVVNVQLDELHSNRENVRLHELRAIRVNNGEIAETLEQAKIKLKEEGRGAMESGRAR